MKSAVTDVQLWFSVQKRVNQGPVVCIHQVFRFNHMVLVNYHTLTTVKEREIELCILLQINIECVRKYKILRVTNHKIKWIGCFTNWPVRDDFLDNVWSLMDVYADDKPFRGLSLIKLMMCLCSRIRPVLCPKKKSRSTV